MAETFLVRSFLAGGPPTLETMVSPGPPCMEHGCLFGLMNNHGSDRIIRIKALDVNEQLTRTTTAQVRCLFYRTSAQADGHPLSMVKFDSAAPDLPAALQVARFPAVATVSGAAFREIQFLGGLVFATALLGLNSALPPRSGMSGGLGLAQFDTWDTAVQGMVLREGEGITLTTGGLSPSPYELEVRVHLNVGGETHLLCEVIPMSSHAPMLGIFNGSGSGVVATVVRIDIRVLHTSDLLRQLSFERISGLDGGFDLPVIPMDSAGDALPEAVAVTRFGAALTANVDGGLGGNRRRGGDAIPFRRWTTPHFGLGPGLASLNLQQTRSPVFKTPSDSDDIVLREGEGIALFQRALASGRGCFEISMLFTAETTGGGGGGGETSHVF